MLMDFRKPIVELKLNLIDTMRKWHFDQRSVGEYFFHYFSEIFVHAVVVIGIEKATVEQIISEPVDLFVGQEDPSVSCEEQDGECVEGFFNQGDLGFLFGHIDPGVGFKVPTEVGDGRRIIVPVASPAVLDPGNHQGAGFLPGLWDQIGRMKESQNRDQSIFHESIQISLL